MITNRFSLRKDARATRVSLPFLLADFPRLMPGDTFTFDSVDDPLHPETAAGRRILLAQPDDRPAITVEVLSVFGPSIATAVASILHARALTDAEFLRNWDGFS